MDHTPIDFTQLLTGRMKSNPLWTSLMEVVSQHVHERVTIPRRELQTIRDTELAHVDDVMRVPGTDKNATITRVIVHHPVAGVDQPESSPDEIIVDMPDIGEVAIPLTSIQNRHWLVRNAQLLGFDFFSQELTDKDYYRIAKFVALYWPESGNEQFVNFMGFIKNARFDLVQLWSKDRPNEEDVEYDGLEGMRPGMIPVWDQGQWYPTSHTELRYDGEAYTKVDLGDIRRLFYALAPIHLVLERIVAAVYGEWDVFTALAGQYKELIQSVTRWQWDDGQTVISHAYAGQLTEVQTLQTKYQWRITGDLMIVVPKEAAVLIAHSGSKTWDSPGLLTIQPPQTGGISEVSWTSQHGLPHRRGDFTLYHPGAAGAANSRFASAFRPEWRNDEIRIGWRRESGLAKVMEVGASDADALLGFDEDWGHAFAFMQGWMETGVHSIQNKLSDGDFGTGTSCTVEMSIRSMYQGAYRHPVAS